MFTILTYILLDIIDYKVRTRKTQCLCVKNSWRDVKWEIFFHYIIIKCIRQSKKLIILSWNEIIFSFNSGHTKVSCNLFSF